MVAKKLGAPDAVVVLSEPASFGAVGVHYESFEQVSDGRRALLQ